MVVANDGLKDTTVARGFDAQEVDGFVAGDRDPGVGAVAIPEKLFTRSESKSSNLLITFGSRIE